MAAYSKLVFHSCHEIGHTWEPSCLKTVAEVARNGFFVAFKIYAPLYMIAAILQRKKKEYFLWKLLPEILQSTLFLGTNAFSFIGLFCLWRRLAGFYFFGNAMLCGVPATLPAYLIERKDRQLLRYIDLLSVFIPTMGGSFIAISIERPKRRLLGHIDILFGFLPAMGASLFAIFLERHQRRGLLAVYMLNVAIETLWRMAVYRKMVTPIRNGEVLLFSSVMAIYMYLFKSKNGLKESMLKGFSFLLGASELPPPELPPSELELNQKSNNNDFDIHSPDVSTSQGRTSPTAARRSYKSSHNKRSSLVSYLPPEVQVLIHKWRQGRKHQLCRHRDGCIASVVERSLRMFGLGYVIQAAIKVLSNLGNFFSRPQAIIDALKHRDNFKLGAFLGSFVGIFKLVNCVLRWVRNRESEVHGLVSGFLAGSSMMFYKSSSIALYLMTKLAEGLYLKGIEANMLPYIKYADILIYTISTSLVFHATVFEPHNLKPAYWKFLLNITKGRFAEMDRTLLDVYGTEASKMFPNYVSKATKLIPGPK